MAGDFEPARGEPQNITQYQGGGSLHEAAHHLFAVVPEVNIVHLAISLLSLFVVVFGLFSGFIKERLYVGEAIIATGFGIAFSGYGAGIFAPRTWSEGHHFDDITIELTRAVIALSVFAIGVELPKAYALRHWKSLAMLLGPIMLLGWMVVGLLVYAIVPGLEFLPALVVAAGMTPTDPILASSVVGKGKFAQEHVPAHIRHLLQAESGCNDGAAFPFLYLALFLLMRETRSVGQAIGSWIYLVLLYQIVLGTIIGAVIGIIARKLLKFSKRRELIDRESMVAMYVALALLVTGLTTLAGSDDLLAAFACGAAFAWDDWFTESIEESNFSSIIDLLANCAIFLYLGATMPFKSWQNENTTLTVWRLVLLAMGVLAFRRLPAMFALQWWIPDIKTRREAIFAGHFGPMGVGAIFISTLAASKLPTPAVPPVTQLDRLALVVQPITYFLVLSSILVHGITIAFFTLGRRVHSRVTSMTRTFTAQSRDSRGVPVLEEPSWMSRVKRAQNREDIIVNRDDDTAEKGDLGKMNLMLNVNDEARGSSDEEKMIVGGGGEGSGSDTAVSEEKGQESPKENFESNHQDTNKPTLLNRESRLREQERRELDDDPPENILADHDNDLDQPRHHSHDHRQYYERHPYVREDEAELGSTASLGRRQSKESAHETRYCKANQTQTWQEGRKIIIDHNDGRDVEVIDLDASPEDACRAMKNPNQRVLTISDREIKREMSLSHQGQKTDQEHEDNAVSKIATRLMKKGVALLHPADEGLTAQEKEAKKRDKLKRDAWCRKEQKFRDSTDREWIQGSKVVTERFDGQVVVRDLTEQEKSDRAARHLAALRALGHPVDSLAAEWNKIVRRDSTSSSTRSNNIVVGDVDRVKGKNVDQSSDRAATPVNGSSIGGSSRGGVPLTRTSRIDPESDDDDDNVIDSSTGAATTTSAVASSNPAREESLQPASSAYPSSSSSGSASRPGAPMRTNSAFQAVKQMIGLNVDSNQQEQINKKKLKISSPIVVHEQDEQEMSSEARVSSGASNDRQRSTSRNRKQPSMTSPQQQQSIRFAKVDKPSRSNTGNSNNEGSGTVGTRQAPTLGSGLGLKRVSTAGSTRSAK
ncbi:hypothetical protein OIO90_002589 [Microbotryomycetes sp. JL221]|nr:hypothetical protein OIO90_002589 [Microbotryomycetes sp. JL221]